MYFMSTACELSQGAPAHVDAYGQVEVGKNLIFVDVINGWPLWM